MNLQLHLGCIIWEMECKMYIKVGIFCYLIGQKWAWWEFWVLWWGGTVSWFWKTWKIVEGRGSRMKIWMGKVHGGRLWFGDLQNCHSRASHIGGSLAQNRVHTVVRAIVILLSTLLWWVDRDHQLMVQGWFRAFSDWLDSPPAPLSSCSSKPSVMISGLLCFCTRSIYIHGLILTKLYPENTMWGMCANTNIHNHPQEQYRWTGGQVFEEHWGGHCQRARWPGHRFKHQNTLHDRWHPWRYSPCQRSVGR